MIGSLIFPGIDHLYITCPFCFLQASLYHMGIKNNNNPEAFVTLEILQNFQQCIPGVLQAVIRNPLKIRPGMYDIVSVHQKYLLQTPHPNLSV